MTGASTKAVSTVDVAAFIDAQPVGAFQVKLLLICATVLFLDGFDTTAIGYVAPALAKEWHIGKSALGPVFSAGLFGLMIGALLFGAVTGLQFYAQAIGVPVPTQFLAMLPYVATIVVLVLISRNPNAIRLNAPASLGKPFFAAG